MRRIELATGLCFAAACARPPSAGLVYPSEDDRGAAAVLRVVLSRSIHMPENGTLRPDEYAGVVFDRRRGLIYTGSRDKTLFALDEQSGEIRWELALDDTLASEGAITRDGSTLLFGTDNGTLMAIDLDRHEPRWSYATDGRIRNRPVEGEGAVYFVNSRDQVYSLDLRDGAWRWWYTREFQTEFTVHGRAGLTLVPSRSTGAAVLYTGFDDGRVVALDTASGDALWLQSVAPPAAGPFVDCDSTPLYLREADELVVVGQATGVHGLAAEDGTSRWSFPTRGASTVVEGPGNLLVSASSLEGVFGFERGGRILWRQQLDRGVVSTPVVADDVVFVAHSESGIYGFDATRGTPLVLFDTGSGVSGSPSWQPEKRRLYTISNRGVLVGFEVASR